jgi:DNA-nicking Smr family endonuclease
MNARDDGPEGKNFLSRWSQRKQEARQPERTKPEAAAPEQAAEQAAEPDFDLSSLPTLEELTETTDITAFLRKGVPEQLRNAALRKSWALDPAIRNYVNPALDYGYDWNTPGGVPGSGEIGPGVDVARMVAQIMGTTESVPDDAAAPNPSASAATPSAQEIAAHPAPPELAVQPVRMPEQTPLPAQTSSEGSNNEQPTLAAPQQSVRRHGTAKPVI